MCGCVGLKPTTGRIYQGGRRVCAIGQLLEVNSNAGLMSSTVAGTTITLRSMLSPEVVRKMESEDVDVKPIPWRRELYAPRRKLKIGW